MGDEGPKLFTNKPKKSKLKASTPITKVSSTPVGAAAPPPPPPTHQKEPFFQRFRFPLPSFLEHYKFLVPVVLVVNFTIGAYTLFRVSMRDKVKYDEEMSDLPTGSASTSTTPAPAAAPAITEKPVSLPIHRAPIPEDQQCELFKWMLDEKRKVKPRDAEEKKRIDEEKVILKQFIKAKSLPM